MCLFSGLWICFLSELIVNDDDESDDGGEVHYDANDNRYNDFNDNKPNYADDNKYKDDNDPCCRFTAWLPWRRG